MSYEEQLKTLSLSSLDRRRMRDDLIALCSFLSRRCHEGGALPLFCSWETPLDILHPALGALVQERHRPVKGDKEESHENDQRVAKFFSQRKAESVVVVHHGEENNLKDFLSDFQYLKGVSKKCRDFLYRSVKKRQNQLKEGKFCLNIGNFFLQQEC